MVNYESAWRLEKELAAWKPDCIVCDEGHKIKTHNIAASKALHRLGARVPYRLLLTGTVITNKPIDVFSQYKFADPAVFGSSFYLFRNRYFDMVGYGNYTPVMKKSMEAEFTEKLHSIAFRATKAECLDLPECTDIVQRVELEPAARRVYLQLVKDSYADLASGSVTVTNVLTRLLRLSQLTGGFVGNDADAATEQVSSAKLDALSDLLDSAENDSHKVVVIARFLPEIRAIEKLLQKKQLRYALIHGGVADRPAQMWLPASCLPARTQMGTFCICRNCISTAPISALIPIRNGFTCRYRRPRKSRTETNRKARRSAMPKCARLHRRSLTRAAICQPSR